MSLKEIGEFMSMIKAGLNQQVAHPSNLAVYISVEASLMFVKKANIIAYLACLCFSLCPSGLSKSDCLAIFGNKWLDGEQLLLSRELIKVKNMVEDSLANQIFKSSHIVMLTKKRSTIKKDTMFGMDMTLLKIIEARMNRDELEKVDRTIVTQLIRILEQLYQDSNNEEDIIEAIEDGSQIKKPAALKRKHTRFRDNLDFISNEHENKILLYEGNVWSALMRIGNGKVLHEFNQRPRKTLIRGSTSNTTVNDYTFKNKQSELFHETLKPTKASKFNPATIERKGTFRSKKNSLLRHCFTGRFDVEESPDELVNSQVNTPLTQKDHSNMLAHIKQLVFSDLFKEKENTVISQEVGFEQQSSQIQVNTTLQLHSDRRSQFDTQSLTPLSRGFGKMAIFASLMIKNKVGYKLLLYYYSL